jgi:hypothetical protein
VDLSLDNPRKIAGKCLNLRAIFHHRESAENAMANVGKRGMEAEQNCVAAIHRYLDSDLRFYK